MPIISMPIQSKERSSVRLNISSCTDLSDFMEKFFFPCFISSPKNIELNIFSHIIEYEDGCYIVSSRVTPHTIQCDFSNKKDYVYFVYSRNKITWCNDKDRGVLQNGGFIIFDCNKPFKYEFHIDTDVVCFLLPKSFLCVGKSVFVNNIGSIKNTRYDDVLIELILGLFNYDNQVKVKLAAITSLLAISLYENDVVNLVTKSEFEFKKMISLIKINIGNSELCLNFIASELYMSKSKAQKVFYKNGTSFRLVLKKYRVDALANKLLSEGNKTINKICFDCGFKTVANANIQFKKTYHMSLSEYRRVYRIKSSRLELL
ncbi:helix-turn-helix domain-containing protein [Photobacterium kishitanii]|uniref:helix-turn-helix domain-containing protein n=1 Tax=Photobacterium kishitanii TaxID=318456 RepID=UPI000D17D45B|nr:AraC family transcriptional regulator [Photobacterium kishitanii]PSU15873.1 hypothetical protein CTM84_20015 [Photobacterium kishitanii]